VRATLNASVESLGNSFASHTFNEVWVGGRWRRLNYERIGQNILDPQFLGLMVHVHTFDDLATARLAEGWGSRKQRHSTVFTANNPYVCLTLSDQFGPHAKLDNPPVTAPDQHLQLTITKAYWFHDDAQRPDGIGKDWSKAADPECGHLVIHVKECFPSSGTAQYSAFHERVDRNFELVAENRDPVRAVSWPCWWADPRQGLSEFYLRIETVDFANMTKGIAYELHPSNGSKTHTWTVAPGITVTKR
jgi:hypothetical protein